MISGGEFIDILSAMDPDEISLPVLIEFEDGDGNVAFAGADLYFDSDANGIVVYARYLPGMTED